MNSFSLRPVVRADGPAIAALFRRTFRAALPFIPTLHTPEEDAAFFSGPVMDACTVWVAEANGIAGFIAWRDGWVDHLTVAPENARRGIGGALLGLAMSDQAALELWAFKRNTDALAFYRAKGFCVVRETDGSGNEEKEPDVLLRWERGG